MSDVGQRRSMDMRPARGGGQAAAPQQVRQAPVARQAAQPARPVRQAPAGRQAAQVQPARQHVQEQPVQIEKRSLGQRLRGVTGRRQAAAPAAEQPVAASRQQAAAPMRQSQAATQQRPVRQAAQQPVQQRPVRPAASAPERPMQQTRGGAMQRQAQGYDDASYAVAQPQGSRRSVSAPQYDDASQAEQPALKGGGWRTALQVVIGLLVIAGVATAIVVLYIRYYQ